MRKARAVVRGAPLSQRIAGLALLNLVLMAAVLAGFAQWEFGLSVESLVLGPARDRIQAMANAFGRDLDVTPYESRKELLAEYSMRYGADFYLVNPQGEGMGGEEVALPGAVLERMHEGGPMDQDGRGRGGRGRGPDGRGPGRGGHPPFGPPAERTFVALTGDPLRYWIGVRIPTNGAEGERGVPGVLLVRADSIFNSKLFFDWRGLLWLAAALTGVALACWWPFVRGVTRSIRQMDRATEEIAQGRFDTQIIQQRRDELGHLGEQIQRMAERLETFVKNQKRFLGDIAHELSAPIARIQFALGILEQKIEEPQQPHVGALREEIQGMSELVNELVMFSKAGMQSAPAGLKRVELAGTVKRAVAQQMPGSGTVQMAVPGELTVLANEAYLLRAISNLLRNALRYAGEDGPIVAEAHREGSRVRLSVTDCGPGLPEESLQEVFEPFYRPEAARSRDTGGWGLGLAIVKSCVEACGGTVECRNREPSGLEVTISLAAAE